MKINQLSKKNQNSKNKGANFCQVANNMQPTQLNDLITEGIQKWKGKEPNFNNKPIKNKKDLNKLKNLFSFTNDKEYIQKPPNKKKPLPKAWIKKYFTPLSTSSTEEIDIRRGINDIKFNSKPIQAPIQCADDKHNIEPKKRMKKKNILKGNPKIIKTRMKLNHSN